MPVELLARWLPAPRDLLGGMSVQLTDEQRAAIEARGRELLLDAGAGAGKTMVLVERFVRAVLDDGVPVSAILAITFTDKAAAELRERVRGRLRELGAAEAAHATEGAQISTIHGFCARLLRAHALQAGLDPAFTVLDLDRAQQLAQEAFDAALARIAPSEDGAEAIAAHGPRALSAAITAVYDELRARGELRPSLPPLPGAASAVAWHAACDRAVGAARTAARELDAISAPPARVRRALDALQRACELDPAEIVWPVELGAFALPARNGASALASDACDAYRDALEALRGVAELEHATVARAALDELLIAYGDAYAALKAERSAVDFEDLELLARELLRHDPGLVAELRARFARVMVDELQDTNRLQLELIDLIAAEHLFMVGDAQQSIYGFRYAEVECFEARGQALAASGARLALQTNFRSRAELLEVLNAGFETILGEAAFRPLLPGRADPPAGEELVELLIVDKGAEWEAEGLASPWRQAEARALGRRVRELIDAGTPAGAVVLLTRASTDLRVYERALEDAGVPTYLIGGRGYWSHPQVVELVSYLRALANPRDQEPWLATLCSPLCGVSLDGLVLVAADAREELQRVDRERLDAFEAFFEAERHAAGRIGVEELLERAIERSAYDAALLRMPGGRRRLANVRKLMRLGREWEASAGPDLHGFVTLIDRRAGGAAGPDRESEAPVEGEALDAVRLMTIHRAKGLEFDVVCVADLGRGPRYRHDLIRISRDGERLGLRLARAGTAARIPVLDYDAIGVERAAREQREEQRLYYVAMTRARERLILSGAAKLDTWAKGNQGTPIDWIAPAFVPGIAERPESQVTPGGVRVTIFGEDVCSGAGVGGAASFANGRSFVATPPTPALATLVADAGAVTAAAVAAPSEGALTISSSAGATPAPMAGSSRAGATLAPMAGFSSADTGAASVAALSYSALAEYERCGYRFYVERVLGLPAGEEAAAAGAWLGGRRLSAADRGTVVHGLLERLDFRRPVVRERGELAALGARERREVTAMIDAFTASDTCARLGRATAIRREQRFAFTLAAGAPMITGVLDVLAREGPDRGLVVDYKTDRLGDAPPAALVEERYETQRLIYAIAALRAGFATVEVVHLFLERPEHPVACVLEGAELPRLESELAQRAGGILRHEFAVSAEPQRSLCRGCPAEGGLCSWPRELTRRQASDRLF